MEHKEFKFLPLPAGLSLVNQFSVRKNDFMNEKDFVKFKPFMESLVGFPQKDIVPVYNFTAYGCDEYERHEYSYDMKRLYPLSNKEQKIVNAAPGNLGEKWEDSCNLLREAKKDCKDLYDFLNRALFTLKYKDMHGGNVMKDKDGINFLIDLEGFFI